MIRTGLITGAALLLAACGGSETTVVNTADGEVRTDGAGTYIAEGKDGQKVAITTADTAGSAAAATVTASLPAIAPAYPGASVVSTVTSTGPADGTGAGMAVVMQTADSMDQVLAFYDAKIAAAGKTASMSSSTPESAMRMVADESGGLAAMIGVTDDGETRTVSLTVGTKGK